MREALILLSGGIDSAVALAIAKEKGRSCRALSFHYCQRHRIELESAKKIAAFYDIPHQILFLDPSPFSGSALLTKESLPSNQTVEEITHGAIPPTYVPARNTLFLAYATAFAEKWGSEEIYIGTNKDDENGYPDCRPAFLSAFQALLNVATKQSVTEKAPLLVAPLSGLTKKEIVEKARLLGVPLSLTWSCYAPKEDSLPCRKCDACVLRENALQN